MDGDPNAREEQDVFGDARFFIGVTDSHDVASESLLGDNVTTYRSSQ
jgi:hypothetical protein